MPGVIAGWGWGLLFDTPEYVQSGLYLHVRYSEDLWGCSSTLFRISISCPLFRCVRYSVCPVIGGFTVHKNKLRNTFSAIYNWNVNFSILNISPLYLSVGCGKCSEKTTTLFLIQVLGLFQVKKYYKRYYKQHHITLRA